MRARSLSSVAVGLLLLVACTDDAATTGPSALKEGVARPGRADLPGTANATLEWLGEPLGYTGVPEAINAAGTVVGHNCCGSQVAITWAPGAVAVTLPGQYHLYTLLGINDAGIAVGSGVFVGPVAPGSAVIWDVANGTGAYLGAPVGQTPELATAINNLANVVGYSRTSGSVYNATLWPSSGGAVDLGVGSTQTIANAIAPNLTGAQVIVVGNDDASHPTLAGSQAWVWTGGLRTYLPTLDPNAISQAWDVLDNGWIVGFEQPSGPERALLWRNNVPTDLSPACAADLPVGSSSNSFAYGIAQLVASPGRTIIVGRCNNQPYAWYNNVLGGFDGEMLPLFTGDTEGEARDVNVHGQIVGYSRVTTPDSHHSLRWTFTPPPLNTAPTANAGGPYTGSEGTAFAFNGSGSTDPESDPLTYAWDFGDGSNGSGVAPSHSYADNGSYTVTLTVNDGSLSHTAATTATIANVAPSGVPSAPTTIGVGVPFVMSIAATDPGSVDAAALQYRFNCGTGWGAVTSTPSTSCTLTGPGTYTLRFSVRDKDLATVQYLRTITATTANVAPVVTLTSPSSVTIAVGGSVTITGTFADAAGDTPWLGRVVWGAGQPATSLGNVTPGQILTATRTFTAPGVYAARLEVRDKFNATGRANVTITVQ